MADTAVGEGNISFEAGNFTMKEDKGLAFYYPFFYSFVNSPCCDCFPTKRATSPRGYALETLLKDRLDESIHRRIRE